MMYKKQALHAFFIVWGTAKSMPMTTGPYPNKKMKDVATEHNQKYDN